MWFFSPDFQKLGKENDILALFFLLKNRNSGVRLKSFNLLSKKIDREELFSKAGHLLHDPSWEVRCNVILKFNELEYPGILKHISYILQFGKPEEKIRALQSASGLTVDDISTKENILLQALNDDRLIVQVAAIKELAKYNSSLVIERIMERLHSRHYQLRMEAVKSLSLIDPDFAIDHIIGAMVDSHPDVRYTAGKLLENIDSVKAKIAIDNEKFIKLVRSMNDNYSIRRKTAMAIGEHLMKEGVPLLIKTCNDRYKGVRIESVKSLGNFQNPDHTEIIIKMLRDEYWDIRLEAVLALEKIGGKKAFHAMTVVMKDKNFNVRKEAERVSARLYAYA